MNKTFNTVELTTDATITFDLNAGRSDNQATKLTMQVIDGAVSPVAGTITILGIVDSGNVNSSYQQIGQFDLTAKVPLFIEGSYQSLQFVGASMTATSSTFIAIHATR